MKKLFSFFAVFSFLLCWSARTTAQYNLPENNIWAFGNQMGMNFSGPNPFTVFSSMVNGEGCASVCSPNGQLLFYSNGNKAWAANGSLFPNGQNLDVPANTALTTTQTALIVPIPNQANKYYLFTLGSKLFCYKIDMALNNGLGDVDITFPLTHVALKDSLTEKMIAIRGCDNNVWIIVKPLYAPQFYSFNVTVQGVDTTAVVSNAGFSPLMHYFQNTITASPDGNKIVASTAYAIELFNFDKTNGKVSNNKLIDNQHSYGCSFSPDGKLLFANAGSIYQYNLENCNPASTKILIGGGFPGDIKLAPNGKMYFRSSVSMFNQNYLGSIEKPNIYGAGCQFRDSVTGTAMPILDPSSATTFSLGLSNTVVKASPDVEAVQLNRQYFDTCVCQFPHSTGINLTAAPGFQNYLWSNGSSTAIINIQHPGTYWVNYPTSCGRRTDTFKIRSTIDPVTLTYNNPLITTSGSYQSYKWYKDGSLITGAVGATYTPLVSGIYAVVVTNAQGCTDSAYININKGGTGIEEVHQGLKVSVYPNPATDLVYIESDKPLQAMVTDLSGRVLLAAKRAGKLDISTLKAGIYFLKLLQENGDTVVVRKITKIDQ